MHLDSLEVDYSKQLGRGNKGYVFTGTWNGGNYAVKEVLLEKRKTIRIDKSTISEIKVSATISHPALVKFFGYSLNNQNHTIRLVYELIPGNNLQDIIHDDDGDADDLVQKYHFDTDMVKYQVMLQVSEVLEYIHTRDPEIIHGDIKPANIILTESGHVKVCDLGLSKIRQRNTETISSTAEPGCGTPLYMAPELLLQHKPTSVKTDIYSFGATLYEVIFERYLWDCASYKFKETIYSDDRKIPEIDRLREMMINQRTPHQLKDSEGHLAHPLISKCIQYDRDLRPSAMTVVLDMKDIVIKEKKTTQTC